MIEIVSQLNDVLDGKIKADNTHKDAQLWLKITCFMFAQDVAATPTKNGRTEQLESIKQNNPLFYDDVKSIAKELFKNAKPNT